MDKRDFSLLRLKKTYVMSDLLPPFTALRAFEAAARHMSFAAAAAELNVTPAALSFQIKALETHLGHPLFRRLNRAVELTDAGRALQPGLREGFEALGVAWRAARRVTDNVTLTVTAGPAFTAKWLAPRLFDFAQAHPDIELRFSAGLKIVDIDRGDVNVAIRFGYANDDDVYAKPLLSEWFTPVASPELAKTLKHPEDLHNVALLHADDTAFLSPPCDWAAWFKAAGMEPMDTHGPRFSQADHVLDAALGGSGVALARMTLASKAIKEGRLVAPYKIGLTTDARFRFICSAGAETRPQIKAFETWIMRQAKDAQLETTGYKLIAAEDVVRR